MNTQPDTQMIPPALLREVVRHNYATATSCWTFLEGGRTNRVWRINTPSGAFICKLYTPSDGNPLYPNRPCTEFEALKYVSRHEIAPEPVALLNTAVGEALIYRHLEGRLWRIDADAVAELLARLHRLKPDIPLRMQPSGSRSLLRQIKSITSTLPMSVRSLDAGFRAGTVDPVDRVSIIHTDVVANNIVVTKTGVRLIDWQCPALGDPCEDIASFLSPAMQYLYMGAPMTDDQKAAFLGAYPDRNVIARYKRLAPLFHRRAAAYCYWQAERGNRDYGEAAKYELSALKEFCHDHD